MSAPTAHVAVELVERGHHPALRDAGTAPEWVTLVGDGAADVVRIHADDLRQAQKRTVALRSGSDDVTVLLDIEVLVAATAAQARAELRALDGLGPQPLTSGIRYIGTPSGLAGLISDVVAAGVADGVTLLPLSLAGTLEQVERDVLPRLRRGGFASSLAS